MSTILRMPKPAAQLPLTAESLQPKSVQLRTLTLTNFKHIPALQLRLDGKSAVIAGANGAGKTTVADAWAWLLTGKDSLGRADAEIKTLDRDGAVLHGIDHSVAAELVVEGRVLHLQRTLREKWTAKRGAAKKELTGHETEYLVDGLGVPEREWQDRIAALCGIDPRVLCDPYYFCGLMPWRDRRLLAIGICGDASFEEVVTAEPGLAELGSLLGGRSLDDFRKVSAAELKKAVADLAALPPRLDEARRALAETGADRTAEQAKAALELAQRLLAQAQVEERGAIADGGAASLAEQLAAAERKLERLKANREDDDRVARGRLQRDIADAKDAARSAERRPPAARAEWQRAADSVAQLERAIEAKRAEYQAAYAEPVQVPEIAGACAACGQNLAPERVESARQKAQEEANLARANRLAAIQKAGRALADSVKAERERATAAAQELERAEAAVRTAAEALASAEAALANHLPRPANAEEVEAAATVSRLRTEMEQGGRESGSSQVAEATDRRRAAEEAVTDAQRGLARAEAAQTLRHRIAELEAKRTQMAEEAERLQHAVELAERFTTVKVKLLEGRVNARFAPVAFRLFERQLNGGIAECCDATLDGKPWSALNHAAQVEAGLRCCAVLAEHCGVRLPIFIDGRESVTNLPEIPTQVISLTVDPKAEKLTVTTEETQ